MSGVWDVPAAERVAALRREAAHHPESGARELSDLELLNRAYESAVRDRIDTHDAYMRLLNDLRHHDDQVRAGAVAGFRPQIDRIARHVVTEHLKPYWHLVHRVEHLPERLSAGDIDSLRSHAASVRHWLRQDGPAEDRLDPGDARKHLSTLRTVLAALKGRRGVSTDDALQVMDAALNDGPLLDPFEVGAPEPLPEPAPPAFADPGWTVHAHIWTYQPAPDGGFVTAVRLGDEWRIDLWSPAGPLLARGTAPENEVAALAEALVARAPAWTSDRSDYAWRRFTDTANALRHTDDTSPRVRAATARTTTPHRPPRRPSRHPRRRPSTAAVATDGGHAATWPGESAPQSPTSGPSTDRPGHRPRVVRTSGRHLRRAHGRRTGERPSGRLPAWSCRSGTPSGPTSTSRPAPPLYLLRSPLMSSCTPSPPPTRSERLARSPVVRHGGQWWLVTGSESILATDPTFTSELDRFADAMTAADQAVADLHSQQDDPPTPRPGRRR